ncbi:MAG TPA: MFS transporter [Rhizomicrobium sp.]|nr:MFS transporter [Rhizomicrobium sp.]
METASRPGNAATQQDVEARLRSPRYKSYFLFIFVTMTGFAYMDRVLMNTLGQAIKVDLGLSDTQLGMLGGLSIAVFYAIFAFPSARLAERFKRTYIVAAAVTIWSVMTTLCGVAQNFSQLLGARLGVGIGETGALATQSLISDMFAPNRRASALGILNLGVTAGLLFGAIASGLLVQSLGWRAAFFILGLPGLLLALAIALTIEEPPRGFSDGEPSDERTPPFLSVLKLAFSRRSFVHILIGATIVATVGSGVLQFMHPFFVRRFHLDYAEAAAMFGAINGLTTGIGFIAGGLITDWLATRDKRYYGIVPACGLLIAMPFFIAGYLQSDWRIALPLLAIPGMFSATYFAPTYAVAHNIVTPRMRATIVAIVGLSSGIIALAVGPTLAGFVSDSSAAFYFHGNFAIDCPGGRAASGLGAAVQRDCDTASALGVRNALILLTLLLSWASFHYFMAARTLKRDMA